ncbi:MAG: GGDEF domain-containing protein [Lachnospiraceae bacterium]|nr:GGDEF domain-containing protein [Lachnospiraceae bacterium]
MKKYISITYLVLAIFFFLVIFRVWNKYDVYTTSRQYRHGYQVQKEYEYERYEDPQSPAGIRDEYRFRIDKVTGTYRELVFFTVHENVYVYVDGEQVYYICPAQGNKFGKTPGGVWNSIALEDGEEGSEIRVVLYPVYKGLTGTTPTFYYGEKFAVILHILLQQFPTILVCFICLLLGILFIVYEFYHHKDIEKVEGSLSMLGSFAIVIALWKLTDNEIMYLLFPERHAMHLLPCLLLHLGMVPFIVFVRELNIGVRSKRFWAICIFLSMGIALITTLLQIFGIYDLRETLWVVHLEIVSLLALFFGMAIYEIRHRGMTERLKLHMIALPICTLGVLVDIVVFYLVNGVRGGFFAILGFTAYTVLLGWDSIKGLKELINIGVKAKHFEQKAYHDQLTGLNNRMAYADYTNRDEFSPQRCIIAVFDLNNLKKCNDILGHEKGDIYIKECANIIKETFQDIGQCYRMGGDEFCVLMEQVSLEVCHKRMKQMEELVAQRNQKNPEIKMGIAYGYDMFDNRIDHNINDTSRRADKKMYDRKFKMKQEGSNT